MKIRIATLLQITCIHASFAMAGEDVRSVVSDGEVRGTVRVYYNTRQFETKLDQSAFSLGGNLHFETGALYGVQAGAAFYTAHNLGLNSDHKDKVIPVMPGEDIDILGEAYLKFSALDSVITGGRQIVDTPFANPADAFIIPVSFEAISVFNHSIADLSLSAYYLSTIKNRESDKFVNAGEFATRQLGVSPESTGGTAIVNAAYDVYGLNLQAWFYHFADLYNMGYLEAAYEIPTVFAIKPFVEAQFILQRDVGESLLGKVDTIGYGVKLGATVGAAQLIFAYNGAAERSDAFRNGAILAPYSFSTSAIFTNNQISTLENSDSGDAYKVALNYQLTPALKFNVSHAVFERDNISDTQETDIDLIYNFQGSLKGWSFRNRFAFITSADDSAEMINTRTQLQFVF